MRIRRESQPLKKQKFPFLLPVSLIYLIVCTLLWTGVSFSSYISSANGSDKARVAAGIVSVSHNSNIVIELKCPDDGADKTVTNQFNFSVSNGASEVAMQYDVVVTLDKALPNGITMKLDGKPYSGNTGNQYTFSNAGTFEANKHQSIPHQLTFIGNFDEYKTPGIAEFPITISVYTEQIN
ncbi:MAG: hypothetical protein ACOX60_01470 [Massiliimalia sp.]|jgi:hypothetical protein